MGFLVKTETDPDGSEEIIIRCRSVTPEVRRIKEILESDGAVCPNEMMLTLCGSEYIVPLEKILFFESAGGRTAVHTAERVYYTGKTLAELTDLLGGGFFRISKSCIANIRRISSLHRELTGVCEACFSGCDKKIYISRMYYKPFRERLEEIRLGGR